MRQTKCSNLRYIKNGGSTVFEITLAMAKQTTSRSENKCRRWENLIQQRSYTMVRGIASQLKFTSHINERVRRARTAEILIKGLTKSYGLVPGLVRRIQLSVVQSMALYSVELWWKGQKSHKRTIQQMLNRQARSITRMYPSTPLHPLLCEAGLAPASTLLDHCQRLYAYRLLSLSA